MAVGAAKEGGIVMARKVGADVIKTKVNARDLLTEVDGEVQRIIETRVAEAFPEHGFLVSNVRERRQRYETHDGRRVKKASRRAKTRARTR